MKARARRWAARWGVPGLEGRVEVSFSPRLTASLGRTRPARGVIRLAARLEQGPPRLLLEVLCHELAHVAVHELHGQNARPHGPEWQALMREAGYEPRRAVAAETGAQGPADRVTRARTAYEHRCPVCHIVRLAWRPVRAWRCAACVRAGRDGTLEVGRRDAR